MTDIGLHLFSPDYADEIDTSSQVERWPGTIDCDCTCGKGSECLWPYAPTCWNLPDHTEQKDAE